MDPRTVVTPSGYIKSRFLDDKLSAAILLGIAKEVADENNYFESQSFLIIYCL